MIEIQDLYKYYGDRRAIGPVSTQIERGEIIGLLGLNGAGKTTTLRILACDLLPTSGTVRVDGLDVVERPDDVRTKVGYLPDRPPLYDDMTVHEYLGFAARLRGVPSAEVEKRANDAEELTDVVETRNQLIGSLSHGYRQRVGIAQAIVHRPALVVLDEPISGLDPVQIVEMRELVRGLRGDHTVVLSSHILSEISETCDRILIIDDGEITWSGSENELATELKQGIRIGLTVRVADALGEAASARARELVAKIESVREVEIVDPTEPGDGIASLRIMAGSDVRDGVCRALVNAGIGILQVGRERELESMVLELLGEGADGAGRKKKRRGAAAESSAEPAEAADKDKADSEDKGKADGEDKAGSAAKSEAEA